MLVLSGRSRNSTENIVEGPLRDLTVIRHREGMSAMTRPPLQANVTSSLSVDLVA